MRNGTIQLLRQISTQIDVQSADDVHSADIVPEYNLHDEGEGYVKTDDVGESYFDQDSAAGFEFDSLSAGDFVQYEDNDTEPQPFTFVVKTE